MLKFIRQAEEDSGKFRRKTKHAALKVVFFFFYFEKEFDTVFSKTI